MVLAACVALAGCAGIEEGAEGGELATSSEALCTMPGTPNYSSWLWFTCNSFGPDSTSTSGNYGTDGCGKTYRVRGWVNSGVNYLYAGADWGAEALPTEQAPCETSLLRVYYDGQRKSDSGWDYLGYSGTSYGVWSSNTGTCHIDSATTYGWSLPNYSAYSAFQANGQAWKSGVGWVSVRVYLRQVMLC